MSSNDNLSPTEQKLFEDTAIEAAYQAWVEQELKNSHMPNTSRKQFLMRIRFLLQQGKLP